MPRSIQKIKGVSYVLIYSRKYQHIVGTLPSFFMKIKVDKNIASTFRVSKVPVLIQYNGTKEIKRVYGTKNIKETLLEIPNYI